MVSEVTISALLRKLDVIQAKALRVCSGAFKSSPVPALQVEMGDMPLELRRKQLMGNYWANLRGHSESHPTKGVLSAGFMGSVRGIILVGWGMI